MVSAITFIFKPAIEVLQMKVLVASACVLGMTASAQLEQLAELLGVGLSGGCLIWYLWYSLSTVEPARARELAEARKEFLQALEKERQSRIDEVRELMQLPHRPCQREEGERNQ